jgi:tetratricopeptide (TPR) repeat protein
MLWPEHDAAQGRQALRNGLHGIRRRLGGAVILSTGDHLVGLNSELLSCDAWDLERGGGPECEGDGAETSVEPLQGLHVSHAGPFDRWLSGEQERLRALLRGRAATSNPELPPRPPSRRPYSADAWVLHARGDYLFLRSAHGGSAEDLLRCRECFERALALDPSSAPARAGLANFYAVASRRGVLTPFRERFEHAIEFSERALAIDPTLAAPHVHFAVKALYLDDDFERAGIEFETAVRLDPSYAEGHRFYGVWLGLAGRHAEALLQMEQAVALEPDIPHFLSSLGAARLAVGDRVGAEDALRRTLRYDPRHGPARERLIRLLEEDRRYEAAVEERERPPMLPEAGAYRAALEAGVAPYEELLARVLAGEAEELAARILEGSAESVNDIYSPPVVRLVQLYARLGDRQRARRWALEAKARRPGLAPWLASIPELKTL